MPKKQTKRSLVVNGRQEGFTLPYFDDYATNLINGIKLRQEAVASAQQAYNALRDRQTREFLNNVNTQQSKSSTSTQKQAKASHTAQTDKTFVPAVGRRQNPELDAIPVKEDNTGPLGYAAAIAPFAVASAPFAAAIPTAFANPYVQAGINSYFAAEGVDDIINGRANWSTPINFLPFYGGATKTLANAVGKAYNSGKKAYDTTRLAIGLNNDIRKFTPRYSLKNPRYDIMAAKQGFIPDRISWAEATKPLITRDNAATITPEQWTAAQDAAIARGDIAEAQRLRDLHFKVSTPNNKAVTSKGEPVHNYHGTTSSFTAFDPQKIGSTTGDRSGFFFTDNKVAGKYYSRETGSAWNNLKLMLGLYKGHKPQIYDVYLNTTKPMITDFHGGVDEVGREILAKEAIKNGNDANILQNIIDGPPALPHNVTIMRNPKHIKSADAVIYDDNGVRIPLGKRDNFKVNDIRYSILPLIGGSILYNNSDKYNHSLGGQLRRRSLKSVKHKY